MSQQELRDQFFALIDALEDQLPECGAKEAIIRKLTEAYEWAARYI